MQHNTPAYLNRFLGLLSLGLLLGACAPIGAPKAAPEPSNKPSLTHRSTTRSSTRPSSGPQPEVSPSQKPVQHSLAGKKILLDPGHNGRNTAAQTRRQVPDGRGAMKACNTTGTATSSGYPEHRFNWEVASLLKADLERLGARVYLTRNSDTGTGPCVDERGRLAQKTGADILLSIHANGSDSTATKGFFVMVSQPPINQAQGEPSRRLAHSLIRGLSEAGFTPSTAFGRAPYPRRDLGTLNHSAVPAVMAELGEMRNPEEAALMQSPEGRKRYAQALTAGIESYFKPS